MSIIALLIGCVVLAATFLWVAQPRRNHGSWRIRLVGGAILFIALAGVLTYASFRQQQAPQEIARYIAVYPNAEGLMWVPEVAAEGHWLLETADGLPQVGDFYEQYSKQEGWRLDRTQARDLLHLRMRRRGLTVTIIGTRKEGRSQLVYQVRQKNKQRS